MDREYRRWRAGEAALYLDRVRGMGMRVKSLKYAIEDLMLAASGVKGIDYSRDAVASSPSSDAIPDAVADLQGLAAELEGKREAYRREIAAVCRAIQRMGSEQSAAIIEMHYVAGRTWRECAEVYHYTKQGMMTARQIALSEFYDVMPRTQVDEIPAAEE